MEGFAACFSGLEDPREDNARHDLHAILMIAFCAMLCGVEDCSDMAVFGRAKLPFLRQFLPPRRGVPSHDTFSRVLRLLDPARFEACLARFVAGFAEAAPGVVAVDGKTLRRSYDRAAGASPLHLVGAWACGARLVLGQVAVEDGSNEIAAVPELLQMLSREGRVVTADAMGCQRAIAERVVAQGGDDVLALKGNQGTLHGDVKLYLDDPEHAPGSEYSRDVDGGHGRIETRAAFVRADVGWLGRHAWPGLAAVGKVERTREAGGATSREAAYFLLSAPLPPERFAEVARAHRGIENGLHWVLDVTMGEDRSRSRTGNGPRNVALLRRLALNAMALEGSKGSNKGKFKRAGWDDAFLARLLASAGKSQAQQP